MATNTNDNGNDKNPMIPHSWYFVRLRHFFAVYIASGMVSIILSQINPASEFVSSAISNDRMKRTADTENRDKKKS